MTSASRTPFWQDRESPPPYPALAEDMEVHVAIIGAGIVGLTCAWHLQQAGVGVAVFEARRLGQQALGRSTAKVTSQHGMRYAKLIGSFGKDGAQIYADANQQAVRQIAELCAGMPDRGGLEERPAYIYAATAGEADTLRHEAEAAASLDLPAEMVHDPVLPFETTALLRFSGQYQFDPYLYSIGLAGLAARGAQIFEHSRVSEVTHGERCRLTVNGHTVTARQVVVATQMPVVNDGMFFAKAYPFAHPIVAARLPEGKPVDGMFISVASPSHSLRTARRDGETYLIAAGGEYKTGETQMQEQMLAELGEFLDRNFGIGDYSHSWVNEDFRPMDGMAFVGPVSAAKDNLMIATGFDAWGITQGTVAADIIAARILGRRHAAAEIFNSTRVKPVSGGATFLKENISAARHMVSDRVLKRQTVALADIAPGSAGIVERDGELCAVHKQEDGTVNALSAVCTHMGCIVGWNPVDRTWDCPCHGSRFDETGAVLFGPAVAPLEPRPFPGSGGHDG